MQQQRCLVVFAWLILANIPFIWGSNSTKKESNLEKPLASSISRLPAAFDNFVINSTNLDEESTIVSKKVAEVKEVREPPEIEPPRKPQQNQSSAHEPSSTPTDENYVTIGHHGLKLSKLHNYSDHLETGFKPFIPSPPFIHEVATPIFEDENEHLRTIKFKSSAPVKHEQFYSPDFNNNPPYGELHYNEYDVDLPYSKLHNEKLPYITTYAPPKINPMQRPNLYYKGKKKYPYQFEEYGKTNEFVHPDFNHHKFPSDFSAQNAFFDGHDDSFLHNHPHKHSYSEKPYKNNALFHILTTLLPIGLFLSALPPKVVFINATNPRPTPAPIGLKPYFRNTNENAEEVDLNSIIYNLLSNVGLAPSDDTVCNKMKICQAALAGSGSSEKSSFAEYSLWYLLSRSTASIRKKLHLEDVFEAVQQQQCEKFSCSQENVTQKNQT